MNISEITAMDRSSVLHPFTYLKNYAAGETDPTIMETAKGVRITDATGREYIDGFAGLYCVNIGYGRTEVAEAIARQAYKLAYYHSYAAHTTEELAKLSDRLVRMAPGKMSKVFYGLSGSDANETQAKIVWYYNNLRGLPQKKKIIARERGYHGCSVVSGSMTGLSFYHDHMDLPVSGILRTGVPHYYRGAAPGETEEDFSQRRADELEALILAEGPDTVGAFIAEPVLGTGGITPPPEGYWPKIQSVLDKYDVLLIADEVVCGFGRTGEWFGSQAFGMEPDLITVAKGITSAYVPLSACLLSESVWDVIASGADTFGLFSHGYTYSAHPLAATAALTNLDIIERDGLMGQAKARGDHLHQRLRDAFEGHPLVGEIRGHGLVGAVELVEAQDPLRRFEPRGKVSGALVKRARELGVITRALPNADTISFSPPFVVTEAELDQMVAGTRQALDDVCRDLGLT